MSRRIVWLCVVFVCVVGVGSMYFMASRGSVDDVKLSDGVIGGGVVRVSDKEIVVR